MRLGHGEDFRCRVDAEHAGGVWLARGALGEDAAAAADVEVAEARGRWGELRGKAALDEGVAHLVHEMEQAGWAVRIPPARGESVEVRYFGRVDRAVAMFGGG